MTTEKDVKIHVKGLKKSFGHVHVLKGIDAEIKAGEVICVIGHVLVLVSQHFFAV